MKAVHACDISKKDIILVNFGQFEDENPLNNIHI